MDPFRQTIIVAEPNALKKKKRKGEKTKKATPPMNKETLRRLWDCVNTCPFAYLIKY